MFFIRLVGEYVVTVNVVFDFINLCYFGGTLTDKKSADDEARVKKSE